MGESLLKKSFQEKDIKRLRSLVSGNYGSSTQTVIGYDTKYQDHKEGDVWEENGKEWKMEDGVKVAVSKLHKARKASQIPLKCPKCGKPLNTRLDRKFYPIHHTCYDCVVKFEDDLKRAGLYRAYEQSMMSNNITSFVEELKKRLETMKSDTKVKTVTEDGLVEDWGNISDRFVKDVEEWASLLMDKV